MDSFLIISLVGNMAMFGGLIATINTMRQDRKKAQADVEKARANAKEADHDAGKKELDLLKDFKEVNDMLTTEIKKISTSMLEIDRQNRELSRKVDCLTEENIHLKKQVEELTEMLSNVKTITRKG